MSKEIKIEEHKLDEIFRKFSIHIVGTVLKRVELFGKLKEEDEEILKKSLKEVIYEGNRVIKQSIKLSDKPIVKFVSNKSK